MTAGLLVMLVSLRASAQIPYYAGTVGDGRLYGYTSLKARPGINRQETYTTFHYGLGDHFAKNWNLYFWGHDFLNSHPRIVVGIDFVM